MKSGKIVSIAKTIRLIFTQNKFVLPLDIQMRVDKYWDSQIRSGKNYTRGEVFTISDVREDKKSISIKFSLTDYAHYLYSRSFSLPQKYACKNVHTSCLIETMDGVLIFGKMNSYTSGAGRIQCVGGGLDKTDIKSGEIDPYYNIKKELQEEVGLNADDSATVSALKLKYLKYSEEINAIALIFMLGLKISAKEFRRRYDIFECELKGNNMVPEFSELIYLSKKKKDIDNFFRDEQFYLLDHYMKPLLKKMTI